MSAVLCGVISITEGGEVRHERLLERKVAQHAVGAWFATSRRSRGMVPISEPYAWVTFITGYRDAEHRDTTPTTRGPTLPHLAQESACASL